MLKYILIAGCILILFIFFTEWVPIVLAFGAIGGGIYLYIRGRE